MSSRDEEKREMATKERKDGGSNREVLEMREIEYEKKKRAFSDRGVVCQGNGTRSGTRNGNHLLRWSLAPENLLSRSG